MQNEAAQKHVRGERIRRCRPKPFQKCSDDDWKHRVHAVQRRWIQATLSDSEIKGAYRKSYFRDCNESNLCLRTWCGCIFRIRLCHHGNRSDFYSDHGYFLRVRLQKRRGQRKGSVDRNNHDPRIVRHHSLHFQQNIGGHTDLIIKFVRIYDGTFQSQLAEGAHLPWSRGSALCNSKDFETSTTALSVPKRIQTDRNDSPLVGITFLLGARLPAGTAFGG